MKSSILYWIILWLTGEGTTEKKVNEEFNIVLDHIMAHWGRDNREESQWRVQYCIGSYYDSLGKGQQKRKSMKSSILYWIILWLTGEGTTEKKVNEEFNIVLDHIMTHWGRDNRKESQWRVQYCIGSYYGSLGKGQQRRKSMKSSILYWIILWLTGEGTTEQKVNEEFNIVLDHIMAHWGRDNRKESQWRVQYCSRSYYDSLGKGQQSKKSMKSSILYWIILWLTGEGTTEQKVNEEFNIVVDHIMTHWGRDNRAKSQWRVQYCIGSYYGSLGKGQQRRKSMNSSILYWIILWLTGEWDNREESQWRVQYCIGSYYGSLGKGQQSKKSMKSSILYWIILWLTGEGTTEQKVNEEFNIVVDHIMAHWGRDNKEESQWTVQYCIGSYYDSLGKGQQRRKSMKSSILYWIILWLTGGGTTEKKVNEGFNIVVDHIMAHWGRDNREESQWRVQYCIGSYYGSLGKGQQSKKSMKSSILYWIILWLTGGGTTEKKVNEGFNIVVDHIMAHWGRDNREESQWRVQYCIESYYGSLGKGQQRRKSMKSSILYWIILWLTGGGTTEKKVNEGFNIVVDHIMAHWGRDNREESQWRVQYCIGSYYDSLGKGQQRRKSMKSSIFYWIILWLTGEGTTEKKVNEEFNIVLDHIMAHWGRDNRKESQWRVQYCSRSYYGSLGKGQQSKKSMKSSILYWIILWLTGEGTTEKKVNEEFNIVVDHIMAHWGRDNREESQWRVQYCIGSYYGSLGKGQQSKKSMKSSILYWIILWLTGEGTTEQKVNEEFNIVLDHIMTHWGRDNRKESQWRVQYCSRSYYGSLGKGQQSKTSMKSSILYWIILWLTGGGTTEKKVNEGFNIVVDHIMTHWGRDNREESQWRVQYCIGSYYDSLGEGQQRRKSMKGSIL